MCGIAGFAEARKDVGPDAMRDNATAMGGSLCHRGPDDEGLWMDPSAGVALAHRRLAILDLSETGRQPMQSACGRLVIITNGEIYNYRDLSGRLRSTGYVFRGSSDTEVMLAAISEWGLIQAVQEFDGMFAFALWDRQERTLHLCRDRIGEKPLYYGWCGNVFLFGSELKAICRHPSFDAQIDRDALALYVRYGHVPGPYSIYRGIKKVIPGSIVSLNANQGRADASTHTYWSARNTAECGLANPFAGSGEEAADCLAALLSRSVESRMQSDVAIGAFLSGGYDSSTVVSLMQRHGGGVKTFALGFEEADETPYAREVARHLRTHHVEMHVTADDALQVIPRIPVLYDEPFSDSSQIPAFLISQLARRDVSVILTGDGGDELFCGYGRYDETRFPGPASAERIERYRMYMSRWDNPDEIVIGGREPENPMSQPDCWLRRGEFCDQMMHLDAVAYLPDDLLVKVDRAAMGVGLETRAPFLDHRVIAFAWSLPFRMKVNEGRRKWILRQVLYRDVPAALVDRPKQGFEIPLATWLLGPLRNWAESLLDENRLTNEGFLNPRRVRNKWDEFLSGNQKAKHGIWAILMFQAWLEHGREAQ